MPRRLLSELPLLLGIVVGVAVLTNHGFAYWPLDGPHGNSWDQYRTAAHLVLYDDQGSLDWPTWRLSLYPWLLALLGDARGYPQAASLISSTAIVAMVAAAGVGARALANPVAGGVAALSLALVPEVLQGVVLMDPYPLLGATFGLALALGAAAARWPRVGVVLLAGLAAGLSWGVDSRGVLAVLPAGVMVLLGALDRRGPARLLLPLAFVAAVAVGPAAQHLLRSDAQIRLEAEPVEATSHTILGKLVAQQQHAAMELEQLARQQPRLPVSLACQDGLPTGLSALLPPGPCTRALFRYNVDALRRDRSLPPPWLLLLALPLALLPAGRGPSASQGWRSSLVSVVLFGSVAASALVMLATVVVRGGYFFQFHVALAMLVPVAVHRLAGLVLPARRWRPAASLLALASVLLAWPTIPSAREAHPQTPAPETRLARWFEATLQPGDTIVDCSGSGLTVMLLPRAVRPPGQRGDPGCDPPAPPTTGRRWLLIDAERTAGLEDRGWKPASLDDPTIVTTMGPVRLYLAEGR